MKQSNTVKIVFDDLDLLSIESLKELKRWIMKSYGMRSMNEKEMESSYWNVDRTIGKKVFNSWKQNMDIKRECYPLSVEDVLNDEKFESQKAMDGLMGAEFNS
jgi:hypothetical protein